MTDLLTFKKTHLVLLLREAYDFGKNDGEEYNFREWVKKVINHD